MNSFNRQTLIAALDIGSSKVCCVIARVSRDRKITIAGFGYNASKGIKNGIVTDIRQATYSVCDAIESAEQMASERVERIIVNISGKDIKSRNRTAEISLNKTKPISDLEIKKVIEKGIYRINVENNELIHCLPMGYKIDHGEETIDPRNLFGENLSVDVLLGLVPDITYRNTKTVLDNSHLEIAEKVISPYASGLACLVDDEKELGATVIDIGGGTTSIASFKHGHPTYFGSLGVGGNNVTNDIAWGLLTSFAHAEHLKTLHGCAFLTTQDKNEMINVYPVGEEDDSSIKQVPKSELIHIISSRIEEIFEMVKDKFIEGGNAICTNRIVLTGGTSQLTGIRDVASMAFDRQVRLGRPRSIGNILDISSYPRFQDPSFSTVIGLLLFVLNYTEKKPNKIISKPLNNDGSRFNRIMNWIKQNF
ncbi:MAG: cell division protein FtsA [Alphaproteobacteria bacterium]|nr:cell division protein FtsA [Alphaproteobacteria bacterium]